MLPPHPEQRYQLCHYVHYSQLPELGTMFVHQPRDLHLHQGLQAPLPCQESRVPWAVFPLLTSRWALCVRYARGLRWGRAGQEACESSFLPRSVICSIGSDRLSRNAIQKMLHRGMERGKKTRWGDTVCERERENADEMETCTTQWVTACALFPLFYFLLRFDYLSLPLLVLHNSSQHRVSKSVLLNNAMIDFWCCSRINAWTDPSLSCLP